MSPPVTSGALRHFAACLTVGAMTGILVAITLVVRLYDNGALTDTQRSAVIQTANEILAASNIPTSWPDCAPPKPRPKERVVEPSATGTAFTCHRPLKAGHVAIRLIREAMPAHNEGDLPLGYSLLDPAASAGRFANIYLDRVELVAARAGVDPHVMLGRAIAHEIGHLLLGSPRHAERGLMRALWSRAELAANVASDWRFTEAEGARMRLALNRREPAHADADLQVAVF